MEWVIVFAAGMAGAVVLELLRGIVYGIAALVEWLLDRFERRQHRGHVHVAPIVLPDESAQAVSDWIEEHCAKPRDYIRPPRNREN